MGEELKRLYQTAKDICYWGFWMAMIPLGLMFMWMVQTNPGEVGARMKKLVFGSSANIAVMGADGRLHTLEYNVGGDGRVYYISPYTGRVYQAGASTDPSSALGMEVGWGRPVEYPELLRKADGTMAQPDLGDQRLMEKVLDKNPTGHVPERWRPPAQQTGYTPAYAPQYPGREVTR